MSSRAEKNTPAGETRVPVSVTRIGIYTVRIYDQALYDQALATYYPEEKDTPAGHTKNRPRVIYPQFKRKRRYGWAGKRVEIKDTPA